MDRNSPKGPQLILMNVALGLGTFIEVLDFSIANVSIPHISASLSVSPAQGTWVITSYAAANAIVLPLTGWLSNYFGKARLFAYAVTLFSIMSLFCGLSTSLPMLVFFRTLQGAMAGNLMPLAHSMLMQHNAPGKQGAALGFWAMVVVVAPVLGPVAGGFITEMYTWPWIFYINVPIGIFCGLTIWMVLRDHESPVIKQPIDWIGLTLLIVAVGSIQIVLDRGRELSWFQSDEVIFLSLVGVVCFAYFIIWTLRERFPVVDLDLFRDRNFLLGSLIMTAGYTLFFGMAVTLPLWLQTQQHYTALWAGVAVAPIGVAPIFLSAAIGLNLHRLDLRWMTFFAFIIFSLTFFYQAWFNTQVSLSHIMFTRLLQGVAVALFFIPLVQLSLGNIDPDRYAGASGVFNFMRILVGSGFGTSIAVQIWIHLADTHYFRLAETMTPSHPYSLSLYEQLTHGLGMSPEMASSMYHYLTNQQAYMLSMNDMSWLSGWLFLVLSPLPFLCRRVQVKPVNL